MAIPIHPRQAGVAQTRGRGGHDLAQNGRSAIGPRKMDTASVSGRYHPSHLLLAGYGGPANMSHLAIRGQKAAGRYTRSETGIERFRGLSNSRSSSVSLSRQHRK